jgi:hypothetical protein
MSVLLNHSQGKLTIANEKERGHEELGNRTSY